MSESVHNDELGRLKYTTKEKCGQCGHHLQLRVRETPALVSGVQIVNEDEYLYCPNCFYEGEVKKKKGEKPWKRVDKEAFRANGGDDATRYKKRSGTQRGVREKDRKSFGNSFR